MERGARQARRDQARLLPARDRLGVDPAVGGGAGRTWTSRRAGACARSGRAWAGAACASSCGRSRRASARAAGRRSSSSPARRTGRRARRAGCERPQAGPRSRPPRADALPAYRALVDARAQGRAARRARTLTLLQPLERAQPPGVHQPAARGVRPGGRRAPRRRPTRSSRATLKQALDDGARRPAARARRDGGADEVDALRHLGARVHRRAADRTWSARRRSGPSTPTSAATTRSSRPRRRSPPAAARTRTRSGSPRPASAPRPRTSARAASISDAAGGLPRPARPARALVQRPARDDRLPVHGARGRQVPDRAGQHRPHHRPPGAEGMDRVGRRPRTDRADRPRS